MIAHAAPSAVCLYLTFTSRHVRKYRSSRYCHSSRRPTAVQPLAGSIRKTCVASTSFETPNGCACSTIDAIKELLSPAADQLQERRPGKDCGENSSLPTSVRR